MHPIAEYFLYFFSFTALLAGLSVAGSKRLISIVTAFAALSLSLCVLYLLLDAPDVALTEAAVGAAFSGALLWLTAENLQLEFRSQLSIPLPPSDWSVPVPTFIFAVASWIPYLLETLLQRVLPPCLYMMRYRVLAYMQTRVRRMAGRGGGGGEGGGFGGHARAPPPPPRGRPGPLTPLPSKTKQKTPLSPDHGRRGRAQDCRRPGGPPQDRGRTGQGAG